ncbi:MAG TPA: hypothetical protein VHI52_13535 [Verrucomicrobiae bacterium]|nr:hypothetical protein [Verrucomicrobiae bacterium]
MKTQNASSRPGVDASIARFVSSDLWAALTTSRDKYVWQAQRDTAFETGAG